MCKAETPPCLYRKQGPEKEEQSVAQVKDRAVVSRAEIGRPGGGFQTTDGYNFKQRCEVAKMQGDVGMRRNAMGEREGIEAAKTQRPRRRLTGH